MSTSPRFPLRLRVPADRSPLPIRVGRVAPGVSTLLLAILALPAARAGTPTGGFDSNHSIQIDISEGTGLSWSVDLSGILTYDPASGGLNLPDYGSNVGPGWEWVKENAVDPTTGQTVLRDALKWHTAERVGDESTPWRSTFTIFATGNVDPFLTYAFSAKNNTGATQSYVFTYGESIAPSITGNYTVSADLAGSLTNAVAGTTAKLTPDGADLDGDGIAEVQVLKLSTDNGLTFLASGVDVGGELETGPNAGTSLYGVYSDTASGTATTAINYWEIETRFTLSPGRDAVSLSGYVEISEEANIPEPTTYATLIGALGLGAVLVRRRRRQG